MCCRKELEEVNAARTALSQKCEKLERENKKLSKREKKLNIERQKVLKVEGERDSDMQQSHNVRNVLQELPGQRIQNNSTAIETRNSSYDDAHCQTNPSNAIGCADTATAERDTIGIGGHKIEYRSDRADTSREGISNIARQKSFQEQHNDRGVIQEELAGLGNSPDDLCRLSQVLIVSFLSLLHLCQVTDQ